MSTQLPQTLQDIQDSIQVLTSSDPTTPAISDDQWLTRLNLINRGIRSWESQDVEWRELFSVYTPDIILAGTTAYPITDPSFRMPGSLIRLYTPGSLSPEYIDVIPARRMINYRGSGRVAYFTGNAQDGYTLNLGWVPIAGSPDVGKTFNFDFYKSTDRLVSPSSIPQLSNPEYLAYYASAQELLFNGRTTLAQEYFSECDAIMQNMKIQNEMVPSFASNALEDIEQVRDGFIWGQ